MTFQYNYENLLISLQESQLFISEQLPLLLITVQCLSLLTTSQWVEWLIALHLPGAPLLIVLTISAPPSNIDIPSFESWFKIRSGSFLTVAMILILLLPSYSFGHCSFSQYGLRIVFVIKDDSTPCGLSRRQRIDQVWRTRSSDLSYDCTLCIIVHYDISLLLSG